MVADWKRYQEEVAAFFRSLGLDASTNVTVQGVRTSHDVDVLVKSSHAGFNVTWIVECKQWKTRVSKVHVLALREIVADVGADRGILLSEAGFQSGASEAADLTNVQVTSLAEVAISASDVVYSMRLRDLFDRVDQCRGRYWDIPKYERIDRGLRPDVGQAGYSGDNVVKFAEELLSKAFRGRYPITVEVYAGLIEPKVASEFHSAKEVITELEPLISELEWRLDTHKPRPGNNRCAGA